MDECWDKISVIMRTDFFHFILHKEIISTISEENIILVTGLGSINVCNIKH